MSRSDTSDDADNTAHQDILAHAARVMGSEKATQRWLDDPLLSMNGQRPADLLKTEEGREQLRTILGRIEYGVYL